MSAEQGQDGGMAEEGTCNSSRLLQQRLEFLAPPAGALGLGALVLVGARLAVFVKD